ncbi:FxSxx-COOH system tetratricopeptide repeat protein [Crossiella sp. SN42]|uniref:FxSxx-COOH system tetratricopeptide repeat protein n=1 Tax=Crossiella sp. SN42 TaxID=2944808 RepID=UPI00207C79B8|nr:FxSxx-COOH system tetratricopeptide repeat protein [Crossiella sp. SN42]MCO1577677.1 FxSxx-COOH system tetratricopeptide repeat protein [Crossiella sp. SN42]
MVIEIVLVFVTGLAINAASEHLPSWMGNPWVTWPVLVAVLMFMIGFTVQIRSSGDAGSARKRAWNVPGRNPHFTGRDRDLAELGRLLRARSRVAVHAVRGMGGVGKTQLVLEFCHRHARRFDVVWWISAENPALIPDQLRRLGRELGLEIPPDADEAVQAVLSRLHGLRRWLVVFDNAESVADLHPFLPSGTGRTLVTTRRAGFDAIGGVLDLDTLSRRESTELLAKRAPVLSTAQADELAELLGDLPLALEQAAAYLLQSRMPPDEYLSLLRTSPDGLADKGEDGQRRSPDRSLNTLWTLSLHHLDKHHPQAAQLLALCAYLAPDVIPMNLFTSNAAHLPEPLQTIADKSGLSHVVGVLVDYSLVKRDRDHLVVHRLVQLAVRRHITAAHAGGTDVTHPLSTVFTLLCGDLPDDVYSNPRAWPRWRQLLPHVLAALAHQDTIHDLSPEDTSWLLDRTGTYLQTTGLPNQARPLLERALAIGEAAHGPNHPTVAISLGNLAVVLKELGQPDQARPLLERALAIGEAAHGPNHPTVAAILSNLAVVLQDLGRPDQARPLLERALAIGEATHGPNHPAVATRLGNLAFGLKELGQPDQARPLLERALAIDEAAHGPNHPAVAISLSNLAVVLKDLGQPDQARPLLERALAIGEATHGPNHPTVAISLGNLASALQDLGQPDQARPLLERALAIGEAAHGPNHPTVATSLSNLAVVLKDLGQPDQARPLLERARCIQEARDRISG